MEMPAADAAQDDLVILAELNEHYVRSVAQSDTAWFARHLSADFLNSSPDGTIADRAGFLAQVGKPSPVTQLRCEDVRIRVLRDTAIIHARTTYVRPDGQPGMGRYTDIWMRQPAGGWLCVAAHVTRG